MDYQKENNSKYKCMGGVNNKPIFKNFLLLESIKNKDKFKVIVSNLVYTCFFHV